MALTLATCRRAGVVLAGTFFFFGLDDVMKGATELWQVLPGIKAF